MDEKRIQGLMKQFSLNKEQAEIWLEVTSDEFYGGIDEIIRLTCLKERDRIYRQLTLFGRSNWSVTGMNGNGDQFRENYKKFITEEFKKL